MAMGGKQDGKCLIFSPFSYRATGWLIDHFLSPMSTKFEFGWAVGIYYRGVQNSLVSRECMLCHLSV